MKKLLRGQPAARPLRLASTCLLLALACGSDDGSNPAPSIPDGFGSPAAGSGGASVGSADAPGAAGQSALEGQDPSLPLTGGANNGGDGDNGGSGGAGSTPDPDSFTGPPTTLRQAALASKRLIGTALRANKLTTDTYTAAAREFNYVTPENEMKWDALERNPGQFSFQNADRIVQFAEANDMKVKGHTLVWHSQIPQWVRDLTTRDEALAAMERHITEVVTHFKGKLHAWDVVNEAFTDGNAPRLRGSDPADATSAQNGNGNNGPDSPFRRLIGEDYIDRAFQLAHAADPDALLFYNDYNAEGTSAKANAVFNLVQSMKMRGIPIDGVGLQMHIGTGTDGNRSADQIRQNMERLTALGLQVVYSELDVSLCGNGDIAQRRQLQKQRLADVTKVCMDNPLCTAITFWGIADSDSWRDSACNDGRSEPLLFDPSYQHKDNYAGVFDAILAASTTVQ
ncbi:MAG TPA: endo-1,4-beta-xylanase [Polyangiaceae bacterium]|jgi:endo-1,4-beta-xylanase|nr:endo-1,4-beta-xylanase [Polyangiaceae bacterium]